MSYSSNLLICLLSPRPMPIPSLQIPLELVSIVAALANIGEDVEEDGDINSRRSLDHRIISYNISLALVRLLTD
eukprot:5767891-Pyramimonas_sp.AAC.2